jgi:hypothetical protein
MFSPIESGTGLRSGKISVCLKYILIFLFSTTRDNWWEQLHITATKSKRLKYINSSSLKCFCSQATFEEALELCESKKMSLMAVEKQSEAKEINKFLHMKGLIKVF